MKRLRQLPRLPQDVYKRQFLQGVQEFSMFDPELLRSIGFLPNEYLYYYYHREKALENIQKSGATRGKTIEDVNIHMMEELKTMDIDADPEGALQLSLIHICTFSCDYSRDAEGRGNNLGSDLYHRDLFYFSGLFDSCDDGTSDCQSERGLCSPVSL